MDIEITKLICLIERRMLSSVLLTQVLLHYVNEERSNVSRIVDVLQPEELEQVYDILTMYPRTGYGWSILPATREAFIKSELTITEQADVESMHVQEDRESVKYLRELIRPGSECMATE